MAAISVTRALAERKALDGQITRASGQPFLGVQKGIGNGASVIGVPGKTPADAVKMYQANFDSVEGLIRRRDQLTEAIIISNASTDVQINGVTMKVAVAIERKKSIQLEHQTLQSVITQLRNSGNQIDTGNGQMQVRIDATIVNVLGKDKAKYTPEAQANLKDSIEATDKYSILWHRDLSEWAVQKTEAINKFLSEVDLVLSESNAKTEIFKTDKAELIERLDQAVKVADDLVVAAENFKPAAQ